MSGSKSSNPGSGGVPPPDRDSRAVEVPHPDSQAEAQRSPLSNGLQFTVHPLPQGMPDAVDAANPNTKRSGRLKMLLVLLVSAAPVVASYTAAYVVRPQAAANYAELITPTTSWPTQLALADTQGKRVDPNEWRKQWSLVVFASAACDADCEKRLLAQRQLREMLGRERERLDKIFIVIDDKPLAPALEAALAAKPAVRVLRAPGTQVAAWLGTSVDELAGRLYVIDPMGEWMMRTPREFEPSKFKRDLDRLLRASSSWDRPGRE